MFVFIVEDGDQRKWKFDSSLCTSIDISEPIDWESCIGFERSSGGRKMNRERSRKKVTYFSFLPTTSIRKIKEEGCPEKKKTNKKERWKIRGKKGANIERRQIKKMRRIVSLSPFFYPFVSLLIDSGLIFLYNPLIFFC